jgi:predicted TIM-barrel fold metal-dependent hydrolase
MVHLAAPSTDQSPEARALEAAGRRAYNHWLADLCNELPGRRAGVALIGFDDVDAAVADVRAAHASGLFGGVALKDPINVGLPGLADKRYDPLWAVCEELSMPLNAHAGAGFPGDLAGYMNDPLNFVLLTTLESTLVSSKRVIWHLMAGGAFDRFPALRLVVTEQHMGWVEPLLRELDLGCSKVWWARPMYEQRSALKPSELWARQCFASAFMNRAEAEQYAPYANALNVMWGSDYPHPEGTNPHTRISLRQCFHDLPVDTVATMVGGNMMRAFDFDEKAIRAAAARFGPTPEDIASAPSPDEVPYWAEQSPSFVAGELTTV